MKLVQGTPDDTGTHEIHETLRILWELHNVTQHAVVIKVEVFRQNTWGVEKVWAYNQAPELDSATAILFGIRAGRQLYRNSDLHDDIIEWLRQRGVDVS